MYVCIYREHVSSKRGSQYACNNIHNNKGLNIFSFYNYLKFCFQYTCIHFLESIWIWIDVFEFSFVWINSLIKRLQHEHLSYMYFC